MLTLNLYFKPEQIEALKSANPFNQNIDYKDIKDILQDNNIELEKREMCKICGEQSTFGIC